MALALPLWLATTGVQAQGKSGVTVDVGVDNTPPGKQAFLPVTLSTTDDFRTAHISLEISFPGKLISFREAIKGSAAESAGAEIKTRLKDSGDNAEQSLLQVEMSATEAISQGELLKLAFEVAKDAAAYTVIKLKNSKQKVRSVDGKTLEARGMDGVITVIPPDVPLYGCFFYMH
ncbi:MAG: hypothetical protein HY652_10675 [Acidobacteria bacterium]|nr:hypothetical protein [Acidobacteriota bacterium]